MCAMFIPEVAELGIVGAETLGPIAERFGGKIAGKVLGYASKNPIMATAAVTALSSSFGHHQDHAIHTDMADHVQTFKNVYSEKSHKIKVSHDPSIYYNRGH